MLVKLIGSTACGPKAEPTEHSERKIVDIHVGETPFPVDRKA